jgi:frataxin
VNKHAPTRQVWLSSPVSGAWHFAWNQGRGAWLDTRRGQDILVLLAEEWSSVTGVAVSFG